MTLRINGYDVAFWVNGGVFGLITASVPLNPFQWQWWAFFAVIIIAFIIGQLKSSPIPKD